MRYVINNNKYLAYQPDYNIFWGGAVLDLLGGERVSSLISVNIVLLNIVIDFI